MKQIILAVTIVALSGPFQAFGDDYEIETSPYGSYSGSTDIQMRQRYNYDPSAKFRGQMDSDGSVRMRNFNGDTLRGTIESDGYGRLRDMDGNIYRVRPR